MSSGASVRSKPGGPAGTALVVVAQGRLDAGCQPAQPEWLLLQLGQEPLELGERSHDQAVGVAPRAARTLRGTSPPLHPGRASPA